MLVVPAHAKVNLALEVTGRRPDGWHDIATVITPIDWHDLVGVRLRHRESAGAPVRLQLSGPFAEGVPATADNLAHRAARALLEAAGHPPLALDLWVCKQVPAAAGLGAGSADAAAVLRAGSRLLADHGSAVGADELRRAAERLGSDVPAALDGGAVLATGRGECLQPLTVPRLHLALAVAGASQTAAAYAALDPAELTGNGRARRLAAGDSIGHWRYPNASTPPIDEDLLGSALEPAACRAAPGLADSLRRLRALTPAHRWHLTGSGGAAFTVAPDAAAAARLAAQAAAAGFPARACRTLSSPANARPVLHTRQAV
jgi:4-diphosphocytidyl-2-C-methyl-D-erythritol kinase